ncbi:EAL domain-containing protein [Pediococcus pentosaceus]|uniref:C-di-GMP-specific phosphodiesterase n=1 Tax=Pediococcus pentosaceus (strain ATCC 25745 / CCUG 21536 / LMG 10740 / 183-1w) TaxID=278197 RepID=Q03HV9_PEDPA|nr:EAL domain-containing protein [Pediococcus pentosaceus]ABJ67213.1 C-di-GMP-specific phosphodiesterase [Pediococcus pentosaceus ATCC 25745]AVL02358.1 diguanylate cyclase [Pediococcus pentosaceus]KAF0467863.1 EAL domain-containing protein [Pediococcus pentosaceus]MBF7129060.1 EAL domain-containing protein [Pediococcus pentosaceus]MBF7131813.1 EAL domain-containing protein [Pediococcus pentosaceus]
MTLEKLEIYLWWITVLTAAITIGIIGGYYWWTRNKGSDYLRNDEIPLRYFIQKQVDRKGNTIGYECLLRTQNEAGQWVLPRDFESLPLQRVISLLETTFQSLADEHVTLSIKLTYNQIMSPAFEYFVRWAIAKIEPLNLAIELSIHEMNRLTNRRLFKRRIQIGRSYGVQFTINNVGSSLNDLKHIEWLLSEIDILKASMSSFRKKDPNEWLDLNLQFWNKLAQENEIKLVLVGIENEADEALAEQLRIDARQGYLFGKPEDVYRKQV